METAFLIGLQAVSSLSRLLYEPGRILFMSQWLLLVFLSPSSVVTFYLTDAGRTESVNMKCPIAEA